MSLETSNPKLFTAASSLVTNPQKRSLAQYNINLPMTPEEKPQSSRKISLRGRTNSPDSGSDDSENSLRNYIRNLFR